MDYMNFIFNKLYQKQISINSIDFFKVYGLKKILKIGYYLVIKKICLEPNCHKLYNNLVDDISVYYPKFNFIIFKASIEVLFVILYKKLKYISFSELKIVGYLGTWLGRLFIKLNNALFNNFLVIEKLLLKSYDINILGILTTFISSFLYFLLKSKVYSLDNLYTKHAFTLLHEITMLLFLKSNLKTNLVSLFTNTGITSKKFLWFKNFLKRSKLIKNYFEFRGENFFVIMNKYKNIFLEKKKLISFKSLKLSKYSVTNFFKIFDFRIFLPGESYDKYYILIGIYRKIYFFSEKIFSLRFRNLYKLEIYIMNNKFDFYLLELKSFEFIYNLHIQINHILNVLFNNFLNDDFKFFLNFDWFITNRRYSISQFSFNYQIIENLRNKLLQKLLYQNFDIFTNEINFLKREKVGKALKYHNDKLEKFYFLESGILIRECNFSISQKISKIYFFKKYIIIQNNCFIHKNYKNTIFSVNTKIFKRELLFFLYLKFYHLINKINYFCKVNLFRLFLQKINFVKIFQEILYLNIIDNLDYL
jgi:hypothetical protein